MTTNFKDLSRQFRIVAFVDVLGWRNLTEGIDPLVLRRISQGQILDSTEIGQAERLADSVARASRLDGQLSAIIRELRALATPTEDVVGVPDAVHFWENRHVTFVRFSDNVFIHSSSLKLAMLFVAELLKRGLERGLMLRAGLSCGLTVHAEPEYDASRDARSRDVSLFGDGITTAVLAEKAGSGRGVRVLVHDRLKALLGDDLQNLVRPIDTNTKDVQHEFLWWADFKARWPNTENIELVTSSSNEWIAQICGKLANDSMYEWNRSSPSGAERLHDTLSILSAAVKERSNAGSGTG